MPIDVPKGANLDDVAFSRTKTADDTQTPAERAKVPGAQVLRDATTKLSELIDHGLDSSGAYGLVAPMSSGTQRTRAMAQAHINAERLAAHKWAQVDAEITKNFTPADRTSMWNAMDEQNDILTAGRTPGPDEGINRLPPEQRKIVDAIHQQGDALWEHAKDVGLVKGDGVAYWAPRMMAAIDETTGDYGRPKGSKESATSLRGDGSNITTSAGSTKARKYDTSAETAAAMEAKGGELVRDIRTAPLAMKSFERAIAGRDLINQIKDLGSTVGKEMVSTSSKPGFFTMADNPAFSTYRPKMVEDAQTGKSTPAVDQNGDVVMDRVPLFISEEFRGPLQAIMTTKENALYRGYMLLKSKAMSAIMFSPLTHNMVIAGRAFAYAGVKLPSLYFTGHAARADADLMKLAISKGMVPIGNSNHSMVDVGDIARGIGKPGGWGDPNESWIALGAQKFGNTVKAEMGDKWKTGFDKAGEFWHGTLLWNRIGDLQAGIFKDAFGKLTAKGMDENAAATVAAHMANRYAGAVGRENMSSVARQWANVLLFSRSFNMGNVGAVKDVFYGMPAGLRAQLLEGSGKDAHIALSYAKRKAFTGLVLDLAATVMVTSLVQDVVKRHKDDDWAKQIGDAMSGYGSRASAAWDNVKEHPLSPSSYDPYRLSSTYGSEKEDRVDMGAQPNGRHEYMRLPTGKVVEDTIGWATHPGDTFAKKMAPMAKAAWQIGANDKGYGNPVMDPSDPLVYRAMDAVKHLLKAQLPYDTAQTGVDMINGKATELDKEKFKGNLTGMSISQGSPLGPEGSVAQKVEDRVSTSKKYAMEAVRRDLKYGDDERAAARLTGAGLTGQEVSKIINKEQGKLDGNPPSAAAMRGMMSKFNKHATEEDQKAMEAVRR